MPKKLNIAAKHYLKLCWVAQNFWFLKKQVKPHVGNYFSSASILIAILYYVTVIQKMSKRSWIQIKKGLEYTEGLVMLTLTVIQFDDVEDDKGKLLIRIVYHSTHYVVGCVSLVNSQVGHGSRVQLLFIEFYKISLITIFWLIILILLQFTIVIRKYVTWKSKKFRYLGNLISE